MTDTTIPAEALGNHIAILGKTGSGKSNAAKTVVESLLDAGERVCVVDPTGTWFGLRLTPLGKPSPYPVVIFGGNHADLQIGGAHGAAIAETVGTTTTPAIIDTRLLSVSDRTRFFTDFAETLLRKNQGVLTLVIDEAHLFAPKGKINDPKSGMMLGAANNLVSLGRGIGLRIILISQRPAKVHNDSLGQVETLVAMRMLLPHDREAVKEWVKEQADVGQAAEILASLPKLATGEAWVWAPQLDLLERRRFPLARTFDSGRAPAAGEAGPALAPLDLAAVTARLETVAADVLANDPRNLKAEIARLKAEATKVPSADPAAVEAAEERGRAAGYQDGYADGLVEGEKRGRMQGIGAGIARAASAVNALRVDQVAADLALELPDPATANPPIRQPKPETSTAPAFVKQTVPSPAAAARPAPTGPATQKVLDALAELDAMGVSQPKREFVAMMAGYSNIASKGVREAFSTLRAEDCITIPADGRLTLTEAGRARAGGVSAPMTGDEMRARLVAILGSPVDRILNELVAAYPAALARPDLAQRVGYSNIASKGFREAMSRLRDMGFIDAGDGEVRAADALFPGGK